MYKVYFTNWSFPNSQLFVNTLIPFTPGCSGKWGNIEYTLNKDEADFIVVMCGTKEQVDFKKALYFDAHGTTSPSFKSFEKQECLASFPLNIYLNPAEIWINYTYDQLIALSPPTKTKNLISVITYQTHRKWYRDRIKLVKALLPKYPECDLHGRLSKDFLADKELAPYYKGALGADNYQQCIGTYDSGKNILLNYRYSLEFDQPSPNVLCERFYDAMLLWAMPIYYGANNVEDFFPKNSFLYFNPESDNSEDIQKETDRIIELVKSNFREEHLKEMAEARDLMLNKYQFFAMLHSIINNLDYYRAFKTNGQKVKYI